jgi:FLVCR family feline leukemia virus subgroup C receptor-related protein
MKEFEPINKYKEYPFRYAIAVMFSLLSFTNGMCWVVLSPISVDIAKAYDVSQDVVAIVPMCYLVVYVFINFPSNWVLDRKGIKKGLVVGAILTTLGAALRFFSTYSFGFVILGQIICATGQPFILNAPTKIAVRWFRR